MAIAGIVIGFGGVVLLIRPVPNSGEAMSVPGMAALILASLAWSVGSLYGRNARLPPSQLLGTAMEMVAGGVALMLAATVLGEWINLDLSAISRRSALALLYLTVVGSSAFVAYVWLLRVAPTPLVSTYAYVNPLVALVLGSFLAQEPMTSRILLASTLIIGSVVLVTTAQRQ